MWLRCCLVSMVVLAAAVRARETAGVVSDEAPQALRTNTDACAENAGAALGFARHADGGFEFNTGTLKGRLRAGGRPLGLTSVVHLPTGVALNGMYGLASHYRVFANGRRFGAAAWEWPGRAELQDDGSVLVIWPGAEDRPFELRAVYRWRTPAVLDVATTVIARDELKGFETFLACYLGPTFSRAFGCVRELSPPARGPGFLDAMQEDGDWQMFPRDAGAVSMIRDGRWKLLPHPVEWAIRPRYELALGIRRDEASGLVFGLMAPSSDCFAVAMPYGAEVHYSIYLSLFGRDIPAGGRAVACATLCVDRALADEALLARCRELLAPPLPLPSRVEVES